MTGTSRIRNQRVVGDVIGKYHPHGDTAVYDTIVRMAQPFSMRYLLVDGQGNFGSVDGDARRHALHRSPHGEDWHSMLDDLDKETVDYVANYDESESEPSVLPARIPNLLVNGSAGIAVGMATNIPPHNLTEVINGCLALIDDPKITVKGLMEYIPGRIFPQLRLSTVRMVSRRPIQRAGGESALCVRDPVWRISTEARASVLWCTNCRTRSTRRACWRR